MKLSILVPVYNEEKTLPLVLKRLCNLYVEGVEKEIIIIDDGSIDNTVLQAKKFISEKDKIYLLVHKENKGKGAAVRTGIEKATGDYLLIQDADLEYDPNDIHLLLRPVLEKKAVVVYGTRLKRLPNFTRDERTMSFFTHYMGNKLLSFVTSILYGQWITDMETGYKLFPKNALKGVILYSRGFDFEPEITAKLMKKNFNILEVPISTNPRSANEGKKLNALKDGPVAFWTLLKYRFVN
jgi:glycosyltransferase involved in cell wall biosynthesis